MQKRSIKDPEFLVIDLFCGAGGTTTGFKKAKGTAIKIKNRFHGSGKMKNSAMQRFQTDWDRVKPTTEYFDELFRVSKNQIIWGGNYFHLPPTRCIVCWDKKQPWDNFSQFEMAWTSYDYPAKMFRYSRTGGAHDIGKIHPTQKPEKLYKFCLSKFAKKGDRILDTHLGSGSIAVACIDYGFDLTACELDPNYYESAMKRINQYQQQHNHQLKIF